MVILKAIFIVVGGAGILFGIGAAIATLVEFLENFQRFQDSDSNSYESESEAAVKVIEAEAQAEANRTIAESITPELIQMKEAEARLEHGWVTVQGAGTVVTNP